jgi:MarR family transcriptional regulator, temperature-dependent positive regulator of motility
MVLLTRLSRAVYRRASEDKIGMRLKQFIGLSVLRDHGPMSQQALGESLHLDPNNLVLLLNDAEAAGFVERRRDPSDRRRHIVELTKAGRKAVDKAEREFETVEEEVLGTLSAEERAELRRLLRRALEGNGHPLDAPTVSAQA